MSGGALRPTEAYWKTISILRELLSSDGSTKIGPENSLRLKHRLDRWGYAQQMAYLPIKKPELTIAKTIETFRAVARLLASVVDARTKGITEVSWISKSAHLLNLPALSPLLARRKPSPATITSMVHEVDEFDNLECLLMIGMLYEQSKYEFIDDSKNVVTNMTFANREGCFYTPPDVASFIIERTAERLKESDESAGPPLERLRILDPACGTGTFLLMTVKQIVRDGGNIPDTKAGGALLRNLYGVDIDNDAVQIARLCLALYLGFDLREALTASTNIRQGNSLVSRERLGSVAGDAGEPVSFFKNPIDTLQPFEWTREFPEVGVSSQGGFDLIFMNPPYGRLKVHKSDFTDNETLSRATGKDLDADVASSKTRMSFLSNFFRTNGDYVLSIDGELDWYKLMLERALRLLNPHGMLGCILPSSILADYRCRKIRKYLVERCETYAYLIAESAKLFRTVNQPTSIILARKVSSSSTVYTANGINDSSDLWDVVPTRVSRDLIHRIDPDSHPIPVVQPTGAAILAKLQQFKKLADWDHIVNRRGELDLTAHKRFLSSRPTSIRLLRGDHIERFVLRGPDDTMKEGYVDPRFLDHIQSSAKMEDIGRRRIVGRQCSYLLKKRRLSFTITKGSAVISNSCNYLLVQDESVPLEFLLGILNSSLVEWRFRLTSSNNHVSNREIDRIPIPAFRGDDPVCGAIVKIVDQLTTKYSNLSFGASALPTGFQEYELDALVCLLYGLQIGEIVHVFNGLGEGSKSQNTIEMMKDLSASLCLPYTTTPLLA